MRIDQEIGTLIAALMPRNAIKTYSGCFKRWARFTELRNKSYIVDPMGDIRADELGPLMFDAIQSGPLRDSAETVTLHFRTIAYVRRLQTAVNPCANMPIIKMLRHGERG